MRNQLIFLFLFSSLSVNMFAQSGTKEVLLNINQVSSDLSNATEIYFVKGASSTYKSTEDLKKMFDTLGPQIYSLSSDMVPCNSNGFGNLGGLSVVTIGTNVKEAGIYLLSASNISNFDDGSLILLEDRTTGTITDLRQQTDTVLISEAGKNQTRFYLYVSAPPVLSLVAAGCNNLNGTVSVTEDSGVRWSSVLLFDSNSRLVASLNDTTADFTFGKLSAGNYYMAFTYGAYTFVKPLLMTSNHIILSISGPVLASEVGQNTQFYSDASNASKYAWYFGDGGIITGVANPGYNYYLPGTYTVSLHVTNIYNCSADDSLTINVSAENATSIANVAGNTVKVYSFDKTVVIAGASLTGISNTCEIYNLAGQLIASAPVTSSYFTLNLDHETPGIYLIQVKTESGSFTSKVFIGRS